jgi:hypothetical protein
MAYTGESTDRPIADTSPIDFNSPAIYRDLLQINPLQGIRIISFAVTNGKEINSGIQLFLYLSKLKTVIFINGIHAFTRYQDYQRLSNNIGMEALEIIENIAPLRQQALIPLNLPAEANRN